MAVMRLLSKFALALLVLAMPLVLLAHSGGEEIPKFVSQINVSRDNVATITETIDYDFVNFERHGIKRFVPLRTKAGDSNQFYYYNFKFLGAKQDGTEAEVALSREGEYQVIRLGNPNRTISGLHRYEINYQMWPVVERDPAGDFFNWNLTGNYWEVPIELAQITVNFEPQVQILRQVCYSGPVGSTDQNCRIRGEANSRTFEDLALDSGEGLTADLLLTPNSFSTYLASQDPPPPDWRPILGFIVGVGALLYGIFKRLWSWAKHRYQLSQQIVVPQYESPDKLSPAEIGMLNDNRATMAEISATLIDLAIRGFIKIEQTQSKGLFRKAKYRFHLLKNYKQARDYEKQLLDMIFNDGSSKKVALDEIIASKASSAIETAKKQIEQRLEANGYYTKSSKRRLPWYIRPRLILVVAVSVLNFIAWRNGVSQPLVIFSWVTAFIGVIFGWIISLRTQLSQAGYEQWAEVEGFKTFLTFTEKDRLQFHNAPTKNPKQFHQFLPYAVALGVERQWAKQFEGMDITKQGGWYSSPSGSFHSVAFASSLGSDFSRSVSSSFTPTQSGSGSGGGSSGGGGGSW